MAKTRSLLQQFFDGLAHEHAPEFLNARQKLGHLDMVEPAPATGEGPVPDLASRVRIGLILGTMLSTPATVYAVESCQRLDANLVVYSFLEEEQVLAKLSDHLPAGFDTTQRIEVRHLSGTPTDAVQRAVNRTSRLQFLVCDADGFTGHGVTHRVGLDLNVPVVAVTSCDRKPA
jgi:hypothetical protein